MKLKQFQSKFAKLLVLVLFLNGCVVEDAGTPSKEELVNSELKTLSKDDLSEKEGKSFVGGEGITKINNELANFAFHASLDENGAVKGNWEISTSENVKSYGEINCLIFLDNKTAYVEGVISGFSPELILNQVDGIPTSVYFNVVDNGEGINDLGDQFSNYYFTTEQSCNPELATLMDIESGNIQVKVDADYIFPYTQVLLDDSFKQALIDEGIENNSNYFLTSDIEEITSLNLSNKTITDLSGIENFVNLSELDVSNNQLTRLDVSNNKALTKLICTDNPLTILILSSDDLAAKNVSGKGEIEAKNPANLIELDVSNNQLTSLDISKNTSLEKLNCSSNYITQLDVTNNTVLKEFFVYRNQLSELNVTQNTALTHLRCGINSIVKLDVSANVSLIQLAINMTSIKTLDVSKNVNLEILGCRRNDITCIQVNSIQYSNIPIDWVKEDTTEYSLDCGY